MSPVNEEVLPRFRKLRRLGFARDSAFKLGMKNRARPVNHDHFLRTFSANGVGDTGWNNDADVIAAAMIIAIDKETHDAPRKTGADIAQDHLSASLQKEHHVPLLLIISAQRIVIRLIDEQAAQPIGCCRAFGNTGRMHVKTFCGLRKHARCGPLLRPKADLRKNPFIPPDKFAERSAMTLRMNFSRKNFRPGNPRFLNLVILPFRNRKLACLDTLLRKFLPESFNAIIAGAQCALCTSIDALPQILFSLVHFDTKLWFYLPNEKSARSRERFGL